MAPDTRKEIFKKFTQDEKFSFHKEMVTCKPFFKERLGSEEYQQIIEDLSDSILKELSDYNISKTQLANDRPKDYEKKFFGICFGKHKTNAAKAIANNKAKEVFKNYLSGKGTNPCLFFSKKENQNLMKSLQEGRSNDISEPLFTYAAQLAAHAA